MPYVEILDALTLRGVLFGVLASDDQTLEGTLQHTLDLALTVDIGPDNMMALAQVLSDQGYRIARPDPGASPVPNDVVALSFSRRDRLDADVHVVLAPPLSWDQVALTMSWRPFGEAVVPVVRWQALLAIEDEKKVIARRSIRGSRSQRRAAELIH